MAVDLTKVEVELKKIDKLEDVKTPAVAVTSQPAATNWSVAKYNTFLAKVPKYPRTSVDDGPTHALYAGTRTVNPETVIRTLHGALSYEEHLQKLMPESIVGETELAAASGGFNYPIPQEWKFINKMGSDLCRIYSGRKIQYHCRAMCSMDHLACKDAECN